MGVGRSEKVRTATFGFFKLRKVLGVVLGDSRIVYPHSRCNISKRFALLKKSSELCNLLGRKSLHGGDG